MKKIISWTCTGQTEVEAETNEQAEALFRIMQITIPAVQVEILDTVPN